MENTPNGIRMVEKSTTEKTFSCGHRGPEWFKLDVFGFITKRLKQDTCPDCYIEKVSKNSIRCASCGHIITPGSGVALQNARLNTLGNEDAGTFIDEETALVCMRVGCYISGTYAGHWTENGFVAVA